ncbi:penicillin-binding protein [Radiobacillus sp. PE A8.2]|uniref:penicillin-binding protein n=1 Tax=Radiobacillus sp. PE A8.2 TaxID=3380349 RepID=UPI0038906C6C
MRKNKTTHVMSAVFMIVFVIMFLVISGRFLYIQGTGEVAGVSLEDWAEQKRTNSYSLPANRGIIYDKNKMVLAQDQITYRVYAIVDEEYTVDKSKPKHVLDPQITAEKLSPILNMEVAKVKQSIQWGIDNKKFQVEFGSNGRDLSQTIKEEIDALELPGIQFETESKRYYPNGLFASHVIGLTQKKEVKVEGESDTKEELKTIGITGIEQQLNDTLTGTDGAISYKRDKYNIKLLEPDEIMTEPKNGNDIYLTIDQKIQTLLEDALTQVVEQYNPERITAVIMDPHTGEILGLSNRPSYNPNAIGEVENWYNDVISTPFEPGSTMKIFTLAAAIEEGVYDPNELYQSGSYQNEYMISPIRDYNRKGWGPISFQEGIQRSSNVAAALLAYEKLGPSKFLEYLKAFRFDRKTGIDLPGEKKGYILYDRPIEQVTTSFGQGTTVTPIQQMAAASAIANNGEMVRPYIVSKTVDSQTEEVIKETTPEVIGKPISAKTANKVLDVLGTVVTSEHGSAHNIYNLADYSVAGKTGTAQIAENGEYLSGESNYIFSFLGMAPKENPELIMYVSVKKPELEEHESGSAPVSFIFNNVMENSLHYLKIEPDKNTSQLIETVSVPDLKGETTVTAKQQLEQLGVKLSVIGNGEFINDINPKHETEILPGERVILLTDNITMPDLAGWSTRDVLRFAQLTDTEVEIVGSGFAVSQSVSPNQSLPAELSVEFAPPNGPTNQE